MMNEKERSLKTALRIISQGGTVNPMTIDEDLREYYAASQRKGIVPLEAAIQVVVDAIDSMGLS